METHPDSYPHYICPYFPLYFIPLYFYFFADILRAIHLGFGDPHYFAWFFIALVGVILYCFPLSSFVGWIVFLLYGMSIYPVGFVALEDLKSLHSFIKEEIFKKNGSIIWISNWKENLTDEEFENLTAEETEKLTADWEEVKREVERSIGSPHQRRKKS
jgi:hypothetical protein